MNNEPEAEQMNQEPFELVNFVCDDCGRVLVQALPTAKVLCNRCNQWIEQQSKGCKVCDVNLKKYIMSIS